MDIIHVFEIESDEGLVRKYENSQIRQVDTSLRGLKSAGHHALAKHNRIVLVLVFVYLAMEISRNIAKDECSTATMTLNSKVLSKKFKSFEYAWRLTVDLNTRFDAVFVFLEGHLGNKNY